MIYAGALIISLFFSQIFAAWAKWMGVKFGFLDHPDYRKIHFKPTPLLGGVAIFTAFALTNIIFRYYERTNFWIILTGLIFVVFGLIDDKGIKVRARYKIWSHLVFASLLVFSTGTQLTLFRSYPINFFFTICFITFMTNSFNMLDGMDGLVSGVSAIGAFFFFLLALTNGQNELAVLSLTVMGACLGFLRFNFNPASIFLGEAGSTFLGYIMAVMALRLNVFSVWDVALSLHLSRIQFLSFIIPLIILGIPIFDTSFVFINRFFNRIKLSKAGKDHSHHRIHLMGFSQKNTVLCLYAVQGVLGAIALSLVNANPLQFFALLLIVMIMTVFAWVFLLSVKVYEAQPSLH